MGDPWGPPIWFWFWFWLWHPDPDPDPIFVMGTSRVPIGPELDNGPSFLWGGAPGSHIASYRIYWLYGPITGYIGPPGSYNWFWELDSGPGNWILDLGTGSSSSPSE